MPTISQNALIDKITRVLRADARVEAAGLSGSLGRCEGDEFSDVDVLVLVADLNSTARPQRSALQELEPTGGVRC